MGTWNRLVGMGDCYLEAIAIDPAAQAPAHARWFDLDRRSGPAALTHWAVQVEDIEAACAARPAAGRILDFARDALRWRMAVPEDGRLPFDGLFPALIQWDTAAPAFPDSGLRLTRLQLTHPDGDALRDAIEALIGDDRIEVRRGPVGMAAEIEGPDGRRRLA